jgi:hypothetical protein
MEKPVQESLLHIELREIFFLQQKIFSKNTQAYLKICAKQFPQKLSQNTSKFMHRISVKYSPQFLCLLMYKLYGNVPRKPCP